MRAFEKFLFLTLLLAWTLAPVYTQTPELRAAGESELFLEEGPETDAPSPAGSSDIAAILRMLLVLALAALAVYGVIFFIKRAGRPAPGQDPHLRVLARVNLGGTSSAAVLAVGTKAYLVGSSEGGVSLIAEIQEQEALDAMFLDESLRREAADKKGFPDFRSLFRKVRPDISPPPGPSIENIRQRRNRLRGF